MDTQSQPIVITNDKVDRTQKPKLFDEVTLDPSFTSPKDRPLEDEDLVYYVADTRTAYTFRRYNWQTTKDSSLAERLLSVIQARNIYNRKVVTNKGLTNRQMEQVSAPTIPVLKKWREVRLMAPKVVLFFFSDFDRKLYLKEMEDAKKVATKGAEEAASSGGGLFSRSTRKAASPPSSPTTNDEATSTNNGTELRKENETPKARGGRKPKADE